MDSTTAAGTTRVDIQPQKQGKGKGKALHFPRPEGDHMQPAKAKRSGQDKAGLHFSISRTAKYMKQGRYAERIGGGAPVYLAACMQYVCAEIIELAGSQVEQEKKQRIAPRHVMLAIMKDPELCKMLGNADFARCGVVPNITGVDKRGKKGKKCQAVEEEEKDEDEEMEDAQ